MANAYIQLQPDGGTNKFFRVVVGSYQKALIKNQNRRRTLTGKSDTVEGAIIDAWILTVRVRNVATGADPDGSSYGVLDDLETFYNYNNPNGAITNQFTFIDHEGTSHDAELVGQLAEELITPYVDGEHAWYFVTLSLESLNL